MGWCHLNILLIRGKIVSGHWGQKYFTYKDRGTVEKVRQKVLAAALLVML